MQMELSHKRARVELERAASTSARNYEHFARVSVSADAAVDAAKAQAEHWTESLPGLCALSCWWICLAPPPADLMQFIHTHS
ncbi:hypothetical protein P7K49_003500 [Saguinus oedipus]|uniref:Uncharacterized protein n=1 Tax=Saguinus oedipus TaxID=9490 RepID=A0ABQ9W4N7_SAGOE|nr:hypothetical protein P7K49_003500 [Saguinus oedipus]